MGCWGVGKHVVIMLASPAELELGLSLAIIAVCHLLFVSVCFYIYLYFTPIISFCFSNGKLSLCNIHSKWSGYIFLLLLNPSGPKPK